MKNFWSVPVIAVYLYGVTILTQYGFYSYFHIPSDFITASLTQNFVYFFSLFQLATAIVGLMKWWMWFILVVPVIITTLLYFSNKFWQFIISLIGLIILGLLLGKSYGFGVLIAKTGQTFYVPEGTCALLSTSTKYIIPGFYEGDALLVSLTDDLKLTGEIQVKNLSDIGCGIKYEKVGLIKG